MSSEITVWDPYVFENPRDYIPKSEEEADEIRWTTLSYVSKVQYPTNPKFKIFAETLQDLSKITLMIGSTRFMLMPYNRQKTLKKLVKIVLSNYIP